MNRKLAASVAARLVVALAVLVPAFLATVAALFLFGAVVGTLAMAVAAGASGGLSGRPLLVAAAIGGLLAGICAVAGGVLRGYGAAHARHARVIAETRPPEPDEPDVRDVVTRLARQVDVAAPDVRVAELDDPLAYTVWYDDDRVLVVSTGLLETLEADQREAVLAHELAHVTNGDVRLMTAALVPLLSAVALVETVDRSEEGAGPVGRLFYPVGRLLLIASAAAVALLARGREAAADRGAARITGRPAALAAAIERLDDAAGDRPSEDLRRATAVNALRVLPDDRPADRWLPSADRTRLFDTHPPTDRRVERLRAMDEDRDHR